MTRPFCDGSRPREAHTCTERVRPCTRPSSNDVRALLRRGGAMSQRLGKRNQGRREYMPV
eukprot:7388825-Prymnesium_polylepis.2